MNVLVIFATRSGNTQRVAEAIAEGLRTAASEVRVHSVDEAIGAIGDEVGLIVVGGPTEGRHMAPAVHDFLDRLDASALRGRGAAAFDTATRLPPSTMHQSDPRQRVRRRQRRRRGPSGL